MHLTKYHGVFAPHAALRAAITPAGRGRGASGSSVDAEGPPLARHVAMSWARRLKRILAHLTQRACEEQKDSPFASRAPPQPSLL